MTTPLSRIQPPRLDDRGFDDLVQELLARIPAHTPEWTNPRPGDPGRTLVELFAWLADTMLYRANLIPERQRLAFLRLLGQPLRPALPARGLVCVQLGEESAVPANLAGGAVLPGPVEFETRGELTVFPLTAQVYAKRPLGQAEARQLGDVLNGLRSLYRLDRTPRPYVTSPVFAGDSPAGVASAAGFDVARETVDASLWLALLAPTPELVAAVRESLGAQTGSRFLSVGVAPALRLPAALEELPERARVPHLWQISSGRVVGGRAEYLNLEVIADSTAGLTRRGVLRLSLPGADDIGAPSNDVREELAAGVGNRPPRLDDPECAARLVAWLRLRPIGVVQSLPLSWVGVNAVEVEQLRTLSGILLGQSSGASDLELPLPQGPVDRESLAVEVEEEGLGYAAWRRIEDLGTAGRDDRVFEVDGAAGTVRFGDGVRGRRPAAGARIRLARLRLGGGRAGNLPPATLKEIQARDAAGRRVQRALDVLQPLATDGGEDAETLAQAERRIPAFLRHRDRAVTAVDFRRLAADTPGTRLGRVEVLPRFKPQQRREGVPGVVTVMVLPYQPGFDAPNPRPDRLQLERVHAWLDERRPLATELYVIGCEYVDLALTTAITVRDGFGHDQVLHNVRQALRRRLWPLAPGGSDAAGWPLGRAVADRELEVAVAQVPGVSAVAGVHLFQRPARGSAWRWLRQSRAGQAVTLNLEPWQLPELVGVVAVIGDQVPTTFDGSSAFGGGAGSGAAGSGGTGTGGSGTGSGDDEAVAVPVVPEVC